MIFQLIEKISKKMISSLILRLGREVEKLVKVEELQKARTKGETTN